MRRKSIKRFVVGAILILVFLIPSYLSDTPRLVSDARLEPYDILLNEDLNGDLTNAIWFALENESAKTFSEDDFNHCHILLSRNVYEEKYDTNTYRGTLSGWIEGVAKDYEGLLCHTQEYLNNGLDPWKRNIVIWKGKRPYCAFPSPSFPSPLSEFSETHTLKPVDMEEDVVSTITLYFYLSSKGEIELPDGRHLNVIVKYPHIYTIWTTPRNMRVDLPQ